MKKKKLLFAVFTVTILGACNTADQKVPEIASAYCDCMSGSNNTLSAEAQDAVIKSSSAADPKSALRTEISKLPVDKQESVTKELLDLQTSAMGKCMTLVDNKYKNEKTADRKKFFKKMIAELDGKSACKFTAAFMRLGEAQLTK